MRLKSGCLHSKQVIKSVLQSFKKIKIKKIVLDPVMVAKGGTKLINNAAIIYIKKIDEKYFINNTKYSRGGNFDKN